MAKRCCKVRREMTDAGMADDLKLSSGKVLKIAGNTVVKGRLAHVADPAAISTTALVTTAMTGTANSAPAAETNIDALGGVLTGTLDNTLADVSGSWDATAIATLNKNFKELQAELATQRALNTVLINDAKTYALQLNAAKTDVASIRTALVTLLTRLEASAGHGLLADS